NMADRFAALQADFELVKKDALGRLINKLNQLEEIVTRFEGSTFDFATLRDEINILQALTFTDVLEILRNAQVSALTTVIATPNALDM
ncbi:MAG: EF-P 5-aminopentanol modification-associated protein YfmH, partial [Weissella cibaria]